VNAPPRLGRRLRRNGMPRPGRKPWLGVLTATFATFALVLGLAAVPADSATSAPPAVRATGTARSPGKVSAAACNPYASSLRPSGAPQVTSGSFMAKILARGYLIAGVDQNTYPYGFWSPLDRQLEGFDIDMVRAVADAIFGNPNKVRYVGISDKQRIPDVSDGTVDIVAHTMTITCPRLKQVAFSSVYFDTSQRVLVLKNSPARSLADLRGQKVCATAASDSLAPVAAAGAVPVAVPYWTDCLVLLQQGDVAAISTDAGILDGLRAQDPWTKLVGPPLNDQPYGLAISLQHPDFVRFVNAVLEQMRTDGQWAHSYARWISTQVPAPPPVEYRD
jgi:polar amino acid transport system substrate-binding protein